MCQRLTVHGRQLIRLASSLASKFQYVFRILNTIDCGSWSGNRFAEFFKKKSAGKPFSRSAVVATQKNTRSSDQGISMLLKVSAGN